MDQCKYQHEHGHYEILLRHGYTLLHCYRKYRPWLFLPILKEIIGNNNHPNMYLSMTSSMVDRLYNHVLDFEYHTTSHYHINTRWINTFEYIAGVLDNIPNVIDIEYLEWKKKQDA